MASPLAGCVGPTTSNYLDMPLGSPWDCACSEDSFIKKLFKHSQLIITVYIYMYKPI